MQLSQMNPTAPVPLTPTANWVSYCITNFKWGKGIMGRGDMYMWEGVLLRGRFGRLEEWKVLAIWC